MNRFTLLLVVYLAVYLTDTQAQSTVSDLRLEIIPAVDIAAALDSIPFRDGPEPITPTGIPHQQHSQNAPVFMQEALRDAAFELPGIEFESTPFSLSGSVGWRLERGLAHGADGAFIRGTLEFAHQHVPSDGSLHMLLPNEFARSALGKGWGIIHPLTDTISGPESEYVMIYGPRDEDELSTIWIIAQSSYYYARGMN